MYEITSYQFIFQHSNDTILYLHGWGCNYHYMLDLNMKNKCFNHLFIDLPGFGSNKELPQAFTLKDYVNSILHLIDQLQVRIIYIVGHSFGGKIAIAMTRFLKDLRGLFLIGPSIYHKRRGFIYYAKVFSYKILKRIPILKKFTKKMGSEDYKSASPIMKKTMSNIINESVESSLKATNLPIVLIFAKQDKIVPLYLGKKIKRNAKDAQIILIDGDHFGFLYQKNYLSSVLNAFVENTYDH